MLLVVVMSRLENIDSVRRRAENEIQALPDGDISSRVGKQVRITGEALKAQDPAPRGEPDCSPASEARAPRGRIRTFLSCRCAHDGERFANDMTLQKLVDRLGPVTKMRVLIVGCYIGGEERTVLVAAGRGGLDGVDVLRPHSHMASRDPRASCAMGPVTLFPAGLGGAAALRRALLRVVPDLDAAQKQIALAAAGQLVQKDDLIVLNGGRARARDGVPQRRNRRCPSCG